MPTSWKASSENLQLSAVIVSFPMLLIRANAVDYPKPRTLLYVTGVTILTNYYLFMKFYLGSKICSFLVDTIGL